MVGVTRLVDRAAAVGRRTTTAPDAPLAAAALLGLLATTEIVQRGGLSPAELSTTLLLGLLATAPLALARTQEVAVAGTITAATFLTLATDQRPTAAALLAELVALHLVGLRRPRWVSVLLVVPSPYKRSGRSAG